MRAVVQRVSRASVHIEGRKSGAIGNGLVVLLGVGNGDDMKDVEWMVEKITNLRIFEDGAGKMNRSLSDVQGAALVVSQFTLYGDCRKGRRPSFSNAAEPKYAQSLYKEFVSRMQSYGINVETGRFQSYMQVELVNDGPVTLLLDSKKNF